MYGSSYTADSDEEAIAKAEADGEDVLDIQGMEDEHGMGVFILVIPDDDMEKCEKHGYQTITNTSTSPGMYGDLYFTELACGCSQVEETVFSDLWD